MITRLIRHTAVILATASLVSYANAQNSDEETARTNETLGLDPFTVAILPTDALSDDPSHLELARMLHDEILQQVQSIDGVYVVAPELIQPFSESSIPPEEIGRELGAGSVVVSSVQPAAMGYSIRMRKLSSASGDLEFSSTSTSRICADCVESERIANWVSGWAQLIESRIHPDRAPDRDEESIIARMTFLDTARSEQDRLQALQDLRPPRTSGYPLEYIDGGTALSGEIAAAAAQLALESEDVSIRARIWRTMAGVRDTSLVQPLVFALANDENVLVRRAAAEALAVHTEQTDVREALESAQHDDSDASVRQAAYLATLSAAELYQEFAERVLDSSLHDRERQTALFRMTQLVQEIPAPADPDFNDAVAEFATSSPDPMVRQLAWYGLVSLAGRESTDYLITALSDEPNEAVRERLVSSLAEFLDEPGVIDAVRDSYANDISLLVRNTAEDVLRKHEP